MLISFRGWMLLFCIWWYFRVKKLRKTPAKCQRDHQAVLDFYDRLLHRVEDKAMYDAMQEAKVYLAEQKMLVVMHKVDLCFELFCDFGHPLALAADYSYFFTLAYPIGLLFLAYDN